MQRMVIGNVTANIQEATNIPESFVDQRTKAPEKKINTLNPAPQRRLDFQSFSPNEELHDRSTGEEARSSHRSEWEDWNELNDLVKCPIRIDKWKISFDGNPDHTYIDDFLFRVEFLKRQYNMQWSEVMRDFDRMLKGEANE